MKLATSLAREAERLAVSAREPFQLDDPTLAWLVETGTVEMFAVPARDGGSAGPRSHLFTATAGDLLFGLGAGPGDDAVALVGVGSQQTQLLRVDRSRLRALAADAESAGELATGLDCWIDRLSSAICPPSAPKAYAELRAGARTQLKQAGLAARSADGVVWVEQVTGASRFLDLADLEWSGGDGRRLPLAERAWLVSAGEASLAATDTATLLGHGEPWESLLLFHRLFAELAGRQAAARTRGQRDRLELRRDLNRRTMERANAGLVSILEPLAVADADFGDTVDPVSRGVPAGGGQPGDRVSLRPRRRGRPPAACPTAWSACARPRASATGG